MYRKLFIILLVLSPLILTLFFGYPVKTYKTNQENGIVLSKRCFKVGEFGQFVQCFQTGKRIAGIQLISELQTNLSSLFPLFDVVFISGIIGLIIVLTALVFI